MIKAVIRYTDCLGDERKVNYYLSNSNAKIIKTKRQSICPRVTIIVDTMKELNEIVSVLNRESIYGVSVVKAREMFNLFGMYI